jgi:hypothetical protein
MRFLSVAALVLPLLSLACGDADTPAGPRARFELSGAPAFGDLPFPHDLHRDGDGHVALPTLPVENAIWADVRDLLRERTGFCTTCTVHFPLEGPIDPASLGGDAEVGEAATPSDPVVALDVDPDSPERGTLIPLRVEYDSEGPAITVRPMRGFTLRGGTRYAFALTSRVVGTEGGPVQADDAFAAIRDGGGDETARALTAPALDALEEAGVARDAVVSAAVFTTDEPSAHVASINQLLAAHYEADAGAAVLDRSWRGDDGTLDELLGTPADDKPGMDAPPAEGVEGERAVAHDTTAFVITGTFPAPRIVKGEGVEIGGLRRAESGALELGPNEDVPFMLTIPEGAEVANLPLVIVHWGVGGYRHNSLVFADTFGQYGIAVLGIDAYQHGARAESAKDESHDLRGGDGFMGPDGLPEHDGLGVTSRLFGVAGGDPEIAGSPRYGLAALSQLAADAISVVRFAKGGDLSALEAVDPALAGLRFDPDRVLFIGESLGTIAGTALLTTDAGVGAAVLGVSPGSLIDIFCESPVFRATAELIFLPLLGIDGEYDEVDRRLCMDPLLNLFRWAIEPLEPHALARSIFREPWATGPRPDVLWQFGDLDESVGTAAPDALVAALGIPGSGEFQFADVVATDGELFENVETPSGSATAGAWRFTQAGHGTLGFRHQRSSYEPPIVPPLVKRTTPLDFENPTDQTHAQIAAFFLSRLIDGRGAIAAP